MKGQDDSMKYEINTIYEWTLCNCIYYFTKLKKLPFHILHIHVNTFLLFEGKMHKSSGIVFKFF